MGWFFAMAALIGPIALFFLDIEDDKETFCFIVKIAAILAGILVYYLSEYRDINWLYIPYAVIVWGIRYYFKEEFSWENWIKREIIHFPYATHEERMAVIQNMPRLDYEMAKDFYESIIMSLPQLTEEEENAIQKTPFKIPTDRRTEWEQYKKAVEDRYLNHTIE